MHKGFTLIELLVVVSIVALLTVLILPSYKTGDRQFALQRSASKLAQDLRRAQEMAMSSKEVSGNVPDGFGIHFDSSWENYYVLFADLNNNHHRDAADQDLETIRLESGIRISNLSPSSNFSVLFVSPDPTTWITDVFSGVEARITLVPEGGTISKVILVNSAGLISIE